jgi:hypothetical protein
LKRNQFIKSVLLYSAATTLIPACSTIGSDKKHSAKGSIIPNINTNYRDRDWGDLFLPIVTPIKLDQKNLLRADSAEVNGDPPQTWGFRYFREANWVDGWTTPHGLSISWTIDSPKAFSCNVALTYSCTKESAGSNFEVAQETDGYVGYDYNGRKTINKITGKTEETSSWLHTWLNFEPKKIKGTLNIPQGRSVITLRATDMPKNAEAVMVFHALEITPEPAKPIISEKKEKALRLRSNTDWFVNAKYGVMFHFSPTVYPRYGKRKPFDQAVRDFDVKKFVEMVRETGAGYVYFFVSHGIFWVPAPIKTVDKILPGRTCDRDLIGDVAQELEKYDIRLMLYYNPAYYDDVDWRIAAGWGPQLHLQSPKECGCEVNWDKSKFYQNQINILEELGARYGRSLWGYWFDNGYPHQLFERQMEACKLGNPDRIIGYNSGIYPKVTDFQDYFAGEFGNSPILPPPGYFEEGGAQAGLQPHGTIFIDGAWHHFRPDTEIGPQRFTTENLIDYIKKCIERKMVLTINFNIYQDGSVSPITLEQMKAVRKAIRGV